jgi:glutamine phosphoribosylpyrophosphate amidotransferase
MLLRIDFPTGDELVAFGREEKEIEKMLNVEKVFYSHLSDLSEALDNSSFCKACLNTEYPYPVREGLRV